MQTHHNRTSAGHSKLYTLASVFNEKAPPDYTKISALYRSDRRVLQIQAGWRGGAAIVLVSPHDGRQPGLHQHPVSVQRRLQISESQASTAASRSATLAGGGGSGAVMTMSLYDGVIQGSVELQLPGGWRAAAAAATDDVAAAARRANAAAAAAAAAAASAVEVGDPNAMVADESEDEPVCFRCRRCLPRRAGAGNWAALNAFFHPYCFLWATSGQAPLTQTSSFYHAAGRLLCEGCPVTEANPARPRKPYHPACSAAPSAAASWTAQGFTVDVHNRVLCLDYFPEVRAKVRRLQAAHHAGQARLRPAPVLPKGCGLTMPPHAEVAPGNADACTLQFQPAVLTQPAADRNRAMHMKYCGMESIIPISQPEDHQSAALNTRSGGFNTPASLAESATSVVRLDVAAEKSLGKRLQAGLVPPMAGQVEHHECRAAWMVEPQGVQSQLSEWQTKIGVGGAAGPADLRSRTLASSGPGLAVGRRLSCSPARTGGRRRRKLRRPGMREHQEQVIAASPLTWLSGKTAMLLRWNPTRVPMPLCQRRAAGEASPPLRLSSRVWQFLFSVSGSQFRQQLGQVSESHRLQRQAEAGPGPTRPNSVTATSRPHRPAHSRKLAHNLRVGSSRRRRRVERQYEMRGQRSWAWRMLRSASCCCSSDSQQHVAQAGTGTSRQQQNLGKNFVPAGIVVLRLSSGSESERCPEAGQTRKQRFGRPTALRGHQKRRGGSAGAAAGPVRGFKGRFLVVDAAWLESSRVIVAGRSLPAAAVQLRLLQNLLCSFE
uniref:PHD-type domain-containing protein n=1 Tax=Macrostomum lignano TaxID=282301 RepID=A0A1I8F5C8_9PLAT